MKNTTILSVLLVTIITLTGCSSEKTPQEAKAYFYGDYCKGTAVGKGCAEARSTFVDYEHTQQGLEKNAITVTECEELSKIINSTSDMTKMSNAMKKFVANDCDRRMGEPTRKKRVQEIRDAADAYK